MQESRALGNQGATVRAFKLDTICQLVADLQERVNEEHETKHIRWAGQPQRDDTFSTAADQ